MKRIVDVLNFNADASCLPTRDWLNALQGGTSSLLCKWLDLYRNNGKKIVLGFTGGTVADMAIQNPEAIEFINEHPELFQIVLRPFSHDVSLLRVGRGFQVNFHYGEQAIRKEFRNVCNFFLPPEFMLTNEQLMILHEQNVKGVFINPDRFPEEIRDRIPSIPYDVLGIFGTEMHCLPFRGRLTDAYLHSLHMFDPDAWNKSLGALEDELIFVWRDGESPFLLPAGFSREKHWLENEDASIVRDHIHTSSIGFMPQNDLPAIFYRSYPVHSFTAWMKEFRMLGFVSRIRKIEESLDSLTADQIHLWLATINSDILSAIEKESPVVEIREKAGRTDTEKLVIRRSERGFEGEEFLAILEKTLVSGEMPDYAASSKSSHIERLRNRLYYLNSL